MPREALQGRPLITITKQSFEANIGYEFIICLVYSKQILIGKLKEMKGSNLPNKRRGQYQNSPKLRRQKLPSVQQIIQQIKYLQNCVSQIDTQHPYSQTVTFIPKHNKSERKQKCNSKSQTHKAKLIKQTKRQPQSQQKCQNIQTIRRSSKIIQQNSAILKNQSQNFHLNSIDRFDRSQKKESQNEVYFPLSYISLQVQNFKLEKQNLNLQKQLLQQELMMQRRQKRLLKEKIKRIKTHNLADRLTSHSKKELISNTPKIKVKQQTFSPIKIKIPEFYLYQKSMLANQSRNKSRSKREPSRLIDTHQHSKNDTMKSNKTFQSIISMKNIGDGQDAEELLISDVSRQSINKQNQGHLEKQFWKLMSQAEAQKPQNKWKVREALGDIANKLKQIRKN